MQLCRYTDHFAYAMKILLIAFLAYCCVTLGKSALYSLYTAPKIKKNIEKYWKNFTALTENLTVGSDIASGGTEAQQNEFPYMVSFQINKGHFCGGALISDRHVLTAAHCVVDIVTNRSPGKDLSVEVGSNRIGSGSRHAIKRISYNKKFINELQPHFAPNDIAIIHVSFVWETSVFLPISSLTASKECSIFLVERTSAIVFESEQNQSAQSPIGTQSWHERYRNWFRTGPGRRKDFASVEKIEYRSHILRVV